MSQQNKFTIKSQEALQASQSIAEEYKHQELLPEHLILSLLRDQQSIIMDILHYGHLTEDRGKYK